MRIVFVVSSFPKLSETFIVNKFLGLLDRGWDVHVVCRKHDQSEYRSFPQSARHDQLRGRVHVALPHSPRWLAGLLLSFALVECLALSPHRCLRYLLKGSSRFGLDVFRKLYLDAQFILLRPDLIHFEFGALAAERMYLRDLLGCKTIVSFRGYDLNHVRLDDPHYYQSVWKEADALHLLGQDLWRRAQQRGCPPSKKHDLIPPAIDDELFDPSDRTHTEAAGTIERPLRILSVGRLDWKKGYEYALEAVRLLTEQGVHCKYRIVGDGEYLEAVAFTRHQLGLEEVVELCGALPPAGLGGELIWADLFLHSALSEGFCNAVLEAQSMMLPVVCSDAGGLSESVSDSVSGFVVPRRQPQALAEKMALLARDPELRQRMGLAGRQRVQANFSLPDQLDSFESLYRALLASHRPKAEQRKKPASLDAPAAVTRFLERK